MKLGARWKVVRRGALHSFDRHEPSTFLNGSFLFMTIVLAFMGVGRVDDVAWYFLSVALWLLVVYWSMFEILGHVTKLEEKLAEPDEGLQALRQRAACLPIIGMLPFLAVQALT